MSEIGIDISSHRSKSLKEFMGKKHFGYLITVCARAEERCPSTFPDVSNRVFWDLDDPDAYVGSGEGKLIEFRGTRNQIEQKIRQWLSEQPQ